MVPLNPESFVNLVDHTLLKPDSKNEDLQKLCTEAREHKFFAICVHPYHLEFCKKALEGSAVKLATVVNFPLASNLQSQVESECSEALRLGADEVDTVVRLTEVKNKNWDVIHSELKRLKKLCQDQVLKVILETCLLTEYEKIQVCKICEDTGVDFVKTSTGFSTSGATVEDIQLMKQHFSRGIKASGGIRDLATAEAMVQAGATRLGLSASVKILNELKTRGSSF